MDSFVDLMASHVWTDADITARTEAMIAQAFPAEQAAILQRKMIGAAAGMYSLTTDEQAELQRYAQVSEYARQAGVAARADMAVLAEVLAREAWHRAQDAQQDAGEPPPLSTTAQTLYTRRQEAQ